ncbi:MAG: STN domain-containing protein [Planctomycetes bacterium]|nr:STN domain-containing protein [Planctomycetota bacterium]
MNWRRLLLVCLLSALATSLLAAPPAAEPTLEARWSGVPLRAAVSDLAERYGRGLIIDRRVDPGQPLDVALPSLTVDEVFARAAGSRGLQAVKLGTLVYIGPPAKTERLSTLVAQRKADVQKLPLVARKGWLTTSRWSYSDLTLPRALADAIAEGAGATPRNPELIPHDLWAGATWPGSSAVERLTVTLNQFDLTWAFEDEGRSLRLIPIGDQLAGSGSTGPSSKSGSGIALTPKAPTGKPPAIAPGGEERFTLAVEQVPLEPLLMTLGKRMELTVEIDRASCTAAGVKLDQLVSLSVKRATADELFRELLVPLKLAAQREGKTITIHAPAAR